MSDTAPNPANVPTDVEQLDTDETAAAAAESKVETDVEQLDADETAPVTPTAPPIAAVLHAATVTGADDDIVSLAWSVGAGTEAVNVFDGQTEVGTAITATSLVLQNVANGEHQYTVVAYNAAGSAPASNVVGALVGLSLLIDTVEPMTLTIGKLMTPLQLAAVGGSGGNQFTGQGLPPGLVTSIEGVVSGTPESNPAADTTNQNECIFTVVDSSGASSQTTSVWTLVEPTSTPSYDVNLSTLPAGIAAQFPTESLRYYDFTTGELPSDFAEGWYGNKTAVQNETQMEPGNVVSTSEGLELIVTAAGTGGLVSTYPAFSFSITSPVYTEYAYVPAVDANGNTVDWAELWETTQLVWEGEDDDVETLQPGTDTAASHVHDGENSSAPAGVNYQVVPGQVNHTGILHLPNGERYVIHNGKYVGQMQGLSDAAMTAALKGEAKWIVILGNSHMTGTPLVPSTLLVKAAGVWK